MSRALWVSHTAEKGGAELFLIDVLSGAPEGWDAAFLSDGPGVQAVQAMHRKAHVITASKSVMEVKRSASRLKSLSAAFGLLGVGKRLACTLKKYDVLFANSQKSLFVGAVATTLSGKPLVWVLHDIITDPSFSALNRKMAVATANRFAKVVVVNSQATADSFVASGGNKQLVQIIFNGFDFDSALEDQGVAAARLRREFSLSSNPVVGLFSRLSPWKGQKVLLNALLGIPQLQAVIVGGPLFGDDAYERELKSLCGELGLEGRVRFTGFRNDVRAIMRGVDIVVHTSTDVEPFGRVVVEAQAAERPVIATRGGGVTEIVSDGDTGLLVPPNDVGALTTALRALCEDASLREVLARKGLISARERFDIKTTRSQLVALTDKLSSR